ncbi:glycosyltransferase [Rhodococcus sp. NPDC003383]
MSTGITVAIVGINYAPEPTGIAPYTRGLAVGLARRGHRVHVFTGQPHYPQWTRMDGYRSMRSEESLEGVRVRRFRHFVTRHPTAIKRLIMELTFGLQVSTAKLLRPDVVVCISPPLLTSAMCAARIRLTRHRPPLGIVVHDVYTRAFAEMDMGGGFVERAVEGLESWTMRAADGIAVIHGGFAADMIDRYHVDSRRVRECRNWTHITPSDPAASAAFRARRGWSDNESVVLHAGNMGTKQGLENVIAAAQFAAAQGLPLRFVLLGDGHQRQYLQRMSTSVPCLELVEPVPEKDFPAALGAADLLLVNERPGVARMSMPSKLTSYFAAGRPILAATGEGGFTAREVAASGAGVCIPAGRADILVEEAMRIGQDRDLARRLGEAGRRYCDVMLSESAALDRYEEWIRGLAAGRLEEQR